MVFEKYKFRPFSEKFKQQFYSEKSKLLKIVPTGSLIFHIGSTSIKGLGGKGVVDILIVVEHNKFIATKKKLPLAGYTFSETGSKENRFFFYRDYEYSTKHRRVHVHLTFKDTSESVLPLAFRKLISEDLLLRKEYEKLKKEGIKLSRGDGSKYRSHKNEWIKEKSEIALTKYYPFLKN
ncbi:GrpB family protein [Candidatus Woesearchaeota archaeon]|nr:GrpB family protein [Candidatus Woesearchaeota archaeon]